MCCLPCLKTNKQTNKTIRDGGSHSSLVRFFKFFFLHNRLSYEKISNLFNTTEQNRLLVEEHRFPSVIPPHCLFSYCCVVKSVCMFICIHVLWSSYKHFNNQFFPSIIWVLVATLGFQALVSAFLLVHLIILLLCLNSDPCLFISPQVLLHFRSHPPFSG